MTNDDSSATPTAGRHATNALAAPAAPASTATMEDRPLPPPAAPSPDVRPPRFDPMPVRGGLVALGGVAAVWAVAATGSPVRAVGMWIAASSLIVAASWCVTRDRRAHWLLAASLALLPWLAVRHSPWLISVDLAVAGGLLGTAASVRPDHPIAASVGDLFGGWAASLRAASCGPRIAATDVNTTLSELEIPRHQIAALGRSVVVGLSVCAVAVVLLASGDALFASFLDFDSVWESIGGRALAAAVGAGLMVLVFGSFRSVEPRLRSVSSVSPSTLVVTMVGLTLTLGTYGVVQIVATTAGATYVERRTGLTYAEYARGGFFQLVAVTLITVLVLAAVRSTRAHRSVGPRPFVGLAGLLTLAVLSLVATSVIKLVIYADRFGLTMLRVYTITFAIWLGLVAIGTFVALVRASDRWLTPVVLVSVVVGAFAMNVANPERVVADHNLERARQGADLDLAYLARLSDDARPTILAGLDELGLDRELAQSGRWCVPVNSHGGWIRTNLAVRSATRAQQEFCSDRR